MYALPRRTVLASVNVMTDAGMTPKEWLDAQAAQLPAYGNIPPVTNGTDGYSVTRRPMFSLVDDHPENVMDCGWCLVENFEDFWAQGGPWAATRPVPQ